MNAFKALYIKELKDNRSIFLFVLMAALALHAYGYTRGVEGILPTPYIALAFLPVVAVFVLPFLLIHAFSQEFKGQTHFQLLSLPVSRASIVITKFLAVLSLGALLYVLATGTMHLLYIRLGKLSAPGMHMPGVAGTDLWLIVGQWYFGILLLLMGIATAMSGLKLIVHRFQNFAMTLFFLGSLYLYIRLLAGIFALNLLASHNIEITTGSGGLQQVPLFLPSLLFTLLFSLFFVCLGIFLYERYAEA
ncbi:MAG: ABC transporter permease subunit [Gemmatimonadetes bacterium]|nr:ABC transporter permease subunit [Gemmatimonadota bacterium]